MGNRAVITLDEKPTDSSVGIYVHWNGGAESILAFCEVARKAKVRWEPCYGTARLAQIIANFFEGTLSVGLGTLDTLNCDNGDNGVFSVKWDENKVSLVSYPHGNYKKDGVKLDNAEIMKDPYWKADVNGKTILSEVIEHNPRIFED